MKRITVFLIALAMSVGAVMAEKLSVSILGDSYSTYGGYVAPDTNLVWYPFPQPTNNVKRVEDTWWHQLIQEKGWKLCKNNSYSGSTICYRGYNNEDYRQRSFANRAADLGNPDVILIFGGTNDSWSGAKVGEYKYADWDMRGRKAGMADGEMYTYRPALAQMLDFMTKRYLNVKIYFILNSELREDINESTLTVCKHYGVPVIELKNIEKQMGHPSVKGMKEIAKQVAAAVK